MTAPHRVVSRRQGGLTYIESLLAVVLLAVCIAPALQSIGDIHARQEALLASERDVKCLLHAKELVLAESFQTLLNRATSSYTAGVFGNPVSFPLLSTLNCSTVPTVYILRYDPALPNPFSATGNDMVYVRVQQTDGSAVATLAIAP